VQDHDLIARLPANGDRTPAQLDGLLVSKRESEHLPHRHARPVRAGRADQRVGYTDAIRYIQKAVGGATRHDHADPGLPGENPNSPLLDDAEHWVLVYEQLHTLLEETGVPVSSEHQARYRRRLEYWRGRQMELADGSSGPARSNEVSR
jgi:hypothetical protein